MKNEYKQTPIGSTPEDWNVVRLGDVLTHLRNGLTAKQNKEGNGYPVTRIETISYERINPNKVGFVTKLNERNISDYRLTDGDILFSHINSLEHIGKTAIYDGEPDLLFHGMNLLLLRPNKDKISPGFLLHILRLFRIKQVFRNMAKKAVNQASINQTELGSVKIPLPKRIEEQRKIAKILSTVGNAIQKVDLVIEKTERLKKGLMQDLLTKGIGHKEFKDSELGRIPKEWDVVRLGNNEIAKIIMGQSPPSSTYNERGNGLPFLQGKAEFRDVYPKPIKYTTQPLKIAEKDDILISVRAPVGNVNLAPFKLCIGRGLTGIRFLNDDNLFFFYWFQRMKRFIENLGKGSTFKAITKDELEKLKIPLPQLPEQQKIAEILSTFDKKLELERKRKAKLEWIKKGLMNDLLAGKRRVKTGD